MVLFRFFMALMPIAASVPRTVDTMAAAKVIWRVVVKAPMIVSSWKHSAYHFEGEAAPDNAGFGIIKRKHDQDEDRQI